MAFAGVIWSSLAASVLIGTANAAPAASHATLISRDVASETAYDFVIAGGGVAGLTVAARLTEDPKVKVLVIEAGSSDHDQPFVTVPGLYDPTTYLWPSLSSVPQTALGDKPYPVPIGRAVGGGSVVNGLLWFRSSSIEYDAWEELGATGWTWSDLLPYFKKSETFTPPSKEFAREANVTYVADVHGHDGPVQVSNPNFYYPASGNWWEAAKSLGLTPVEDLNSGNQSGISFTATSVNPKDRTRSDARLSYYTNFKSSRPNYHLLANHTVSKILFDGNRATGLEYLPSDGGATLSVHASKEVLVAAGGAHTPQLLQLSGIGPKSLLDKHDISTVSELPGVGTNMQDTPNFAVPYNVSNNVAPNQQTLATNKTYLAEQASLYNTSREGALVVLAGQSTNLALLPLCNITSQCDGFIASAQAAEAADSLPADTDSTVLAGYAAQRRLRLSALGGQDMVSAFLQWDTGNAVALFLGSPLSRGSININSTDIFANPVIDWRSMTDPLDFEIAIATVLKNREIMNAPGMDALHARETTPFGDDVTDAEALRQALMATASPSLAHVCCTAPMMRKEYGGVVDAEAKVYGVEGLRVIDISTFPVLPTLPPQAVVYASAEKIADMIKHEWALDSA